MKNHCAYNHCYPYFVFVGLIIIGCAGTSIKTEVHTGRAALVTNRTEQALWHFSAAAKLDPKFVAEYGPLQQSIWTYVGKAYYQAENMVEARRALDKAINTFPQDRMAELYLALVKLHSDRQEGTRSGLTLAETVYLLKRGVSSQRVATLVTQRGVQFPWTSRAESRLASAGANESLLNQLRNTQRGRISPVPPRQMQSANTKDLEMIFRDVLQWLNQIAGVPGPGQYWDATGDIRRGIGQSLETISNNQATRETLIADGEWLGKRLEEEIDQAERQHRSEYRALESR